MECVKISLFLGRDNVVKYVVPYYTISMKDMRTPLVAVIVLAIVGLGFIVSVRTKGAHVGTATPKQQMEERFWRERIHLVGAGVAYEEFTTFQKSQSMNYEHRLSHLFGAALYKELDTAALSVCDFETQVGCLHEFFRQYADAHGLSSLVEMETNCEQSEDVKGPCQHAIGHGVLSYYGNTKEGLVQALEMCGASFGYTDVFGCTGGVFMEYNGYLTLDPKDRVRSPEAYWYGACLSVPEKFQRSCVWWLPRWWSEYFMTNNISMTITESYTKMAELCRDLPLIKYRRECFEHVGQTASGASQYDPEKTRSLCKTITLNEAEELYCLSYAASMFTNSTHESQQPYGNMIASTTLPTREKAHAVCAGLSSAKKEYCYHYADNQNYLYNELLPPPSVRE